MNYIKRKFLRFKSYLLSMFVCFNIFIVLSRNKNCYIEQEILLWDIITMLSYAPLWYAGSSQPYFSTTWNRDNTVPVHFQNEPFSGVYQHLILWRIPVDTLNTAMSVADYSKPNNRRNNYLKRKNNYLSHRIIGFSRILKIKIKIKTSFVNP